MSFTAQENTSTKFTCERCQKICKNLAGLKAHQRSCKIQMTQQPIIEQVPQIKPQILDEDDQDILQFLGRKEEQLVLRDCDDLFIGSTKAQKKRQSKKIQKAKKRKVMIDNVNDFRSKLAQDGYQHQIMRKMPDTIQQSKEISNPLLGRTKHLGLEDSRRDRTLEFFGKKYRQNLYKKLQEVIPSEIHDLKTGNVFFRLSNSDHQPLSKYVTNIEDIGKAIEQRMKELSEQYDDIAYSRFYNELFSDSLIIQVISTSSADATEALKRRKTMVKGSQSFNNIMIKNFYLFNPQTVSACFFQSILFYEYVIQTLNSDKDGDYVSKQPDILFKKISQTFRLKQRIAPNTKAPTMDQCVDYMKTMHYKYVFGNEDLDKNEPAYIYIKDGHSTVLFNKSLKFAQKLYDIFRFREERQVSKNIKPAQRAKDTHKLQTLLATYDFEWLYKKINLEEAIEQCTNPEDKKKLQKQLDEHINKGKIRYDQIPYSHGILLDAQENGQDIYYSDFNKQGQLKSFLHNLDLACIKASELGHKKLVLFAHSGSKHDYRLIRKMMYEHCGENDIFTKLQDYATAKTILSANYNHNKTGLYIQFQDSLTWLKDSLKNLCEMYISDKKYHKSDVDHSIISYENIDEQRTIQNIEEYQYLDCKALLLILKEYFAEVFEQTTINVFDENVYSPASLSVKFQFFQYYKDEDPIKQIPSQALKDYVRQAYFGGWTDLQGKRGLVKGKIISIDINSSYPGELVKAFPTGGYSKINNINRQYKGEKLEYGVYRVLVDSSKHTCTIPCLQTFDNGKLVSAWLINKEIKCCHEDIMYAYSQGYQFTIIDGYVGTIVSHPWRKYITESYAKRAELKKQMKEIAHKYPKDTKEFEKDLQWMKLNIKQTIVKELMNSFYGRQGMKDVQESASIVETDHIEFLAQMQSGNVNSFEEFDNFINYSGTTETNLESTHLFTAVYTTARGRIHLHKIMEDLIKIGGTVLYHDTDSVYADIQNVDEANVNKFYSKHCHSSDLGKCKFEMADNFECGCQYASQFCAVCPKTYGMKCDIHNNEKNHFKGIRKSIIKDLNIGFQQLVDLSNGKSIKYTEKRTINYNTLLKNKNVEHTMQTATTESTVNGYYDKQQVDIHGNIHAKVIKGRAIQPNFTLNDIYEVFRNKDQIINKYCDIESLMDQGFEIIQYKHKNTESKARQYALCYDKDYEKVCQMLIEKDQEIHETLSQNICPAFDIDCKMKENGQINPIYEQMKILLENDQQGLTQKDRKKAKSAVGNENDKYYSLKKSIFDILGTTQKQRLTTNIHVWDRSRDGKLSFHVHVNQFQIQKAQLITLIKKADDKLKSCPFYQCIDEGIYRQFGSLRIDMTNISATRVKPVGQTIVLTKINQSQYLDSTALSQDIKIQLMKNKMEAGLKSIDSIQDMTSQIDDFLKEKQLLGKWKANVDKAKKFANYISVPLQRLDFRDKTRCQICKNKTHDNDNNYYVKINATKEMTLMCFKLGK